MNTLRDKVSTILVSKFTVNPDVLAEDPTLDEIGLDSLAIAEFAIAIEKEYGTPVDEEELSGLHTISDVRKLLEHNDADRNAVHDPVALWMIHGPTCE